MPQIQFQLMVTGRDWWDYVSFCDGWPLFVQRVKPIASMQRNISYAMKAADDEVAKVIEAYQAASFSFAMTEKIPEANNSQLT